MTKGLKELTPVEERRLLEVLKALRTPLKHECENGTFSKVAGFEPEFRSRLLMHHEVIGSPLFQESFDSAFIGACREANMSVEEAPSGQRFWDVCVDQHNISLKSTKARSLKDNKLHISKLTEAAWIQDCRKATDRQRQTLKLFEEYCDEVGKILQLRYFQQRNSYELIEIPVYPLFSQIQSIPTQAFNADGPTIRVPYDSDSPDFSVKLDRSDSKITITGIKKEKCITHGVWTILKE